MGHTPPTWNSPASRLLGRTVTTLRRIPVFSQADKLIVHKVCVTFFVRIPQPKAVMPKVILDCRRYVNDMLAASVGTDDCVGISVCVVRMTRLRFGHGLCCYEMHKNWK